MASIDVFPAVPRPPVVTRLRDLFALAQDPLAVALALVAGLMLAAWLAGAMGFGAPLPHDPLMIL